jgi:hypothetical protein
MIILIKAEKAFDKIQHPFMKKTLRKLEIEGIYINIIKIYIQQTHSQRHTKWGKPEAISSKVRDETRFPTFLILVQYSLRIPRQNKKKRESYKSDLDREGGSQIILSADEIILFRNLHQNLLAVINTLSKVTGYKIHSQKSV